MAILGPVWLLLRGKRPVCPTLKAL
jgi:hypothetical protein